MRLRGTLCRWRMRCATAIDWCASRLIWLWLWSSICTPSEQVVIVINHGQSFLSEDCSRHQYTIFNEVWWMVVRKLFCGAGLIEIDVYNPIEKKNHPKRLPLSLSFSVSGRWSGVLVVMAPSVCENYWVITLYPVTTLPEWVPNKPCFTPYRQNYRVITKKYWVIITVPDEPNLVTGKG